MKRDELVHFENACGADYRRTFLTRGEALGAVAIDIDAREPFTVAIENGDLPVTVLAALVALEPGAFTIGVAAGGLAVRFFRAVFLHDSRPRSAGIVVTNYTC
jgi:ferric-dicitrate binding protein FerR (iron transport regulator)